MTLLIMTSRFICEIIVLILCGLWGFQQWKVSGAIGVPLLIIVIWAMFGSPNALYKLQGFYGLILTLCIFSLAGFMLHHLGYTNFAFIFCIVSFGVSSLIYFMDI